jgi:predicted dehydrogenase
MEKLKIGIIGMGWVAQIFHLPTLKKMTDVDIVAVCDKDKPKARYISEKFGIGKIYTDYQEMITKEQMNAVVICTPTDSHKQISIAALQNNLDVFVEKPIARRYTEAVEISENVAKYKRKLMVGMNSRFRPDMMILKSMIEAGELGNIFYAKAGWSKKLSSNSAWVTQKEKAGGGVFLDLGLVCLDTLLWALNFPQIKRVSAVTYNHTTKSVEDSCIAFLKTQDNSTLTLEVSWSFQTAEDLYYFDIFGTKGSSNLNPLRLNKSISGKIVTVSPTKIETQQNISKKSYENELKHFIGAVRGLRPIISTAAEAVQRMKIVEAVYKSAKTRKEVVLK